MTYILYMKPILFTEAEKQGIVYAENQSEYIPMPAYKTDGVEGKITVCWKLSFKERILITFSGRIWHQVLTFNQPLQPQLLLANKPILHETAN